MKRKLLFVAIVVLLVVSLSLVTYSCKKAQTADPIALDAPQNLQATDTLIQWDSVANAVGYVVYVDDERYPATSNMFNFLDTGLGKGTYIISVVAVGDQTAYKDSVNSSAIRFEYKGATYTLQVIAEEGGTTSISKKTYNANDVVDLVAYPKESYHFDGWFSDNYYKLFSGTEFSFKINSDTILYAQFSPDPEALNKESAEGSELMRCAEDFSVVVYCPENNAIEYIKNNFFVYDDYFLDKDGKVVEGCESYAKRKLGSISSRGNGLYLVSPAEQYQRSGAYVARATGNVSILKEYSRIVNGSGELAAADAEGEDLADAGIEEMTFSIENTPHVNMRLLDDVYIFSHGENPNATSSNVDGWIIERVGTGLTDEEAGILGGFITESIVVRRTHTLAVGDVIGFGGNITKDISIEQITDKTVFGKIKNITYCGDERNYPVVFVELVPVENEAEVFAELDVYQEGLVDVEEYIEENEEELTARAVEMFYRSDDYHRFLATVSSAAEAYTEERGLVLLGVTDMGSFLDKIDIKPSVKVSGNEIIFSVKGSINLDFGKKENKVITAGGKLSVSFEFTETLGFEYHFSWVKRDLNLLFFTVRITSGIDFGLVTTQKTDFVFDASVQYSVETHAEKEKVATYMLNERSKKIHKEDCHYVTMMKDENKRVTDKSLLDLEWAGYTPCQICLPATYMLNESTKCIHRRGCWHTKQMLPENKKPSNMDLDTLEARGYWPCGTCLAEEKAEWQDLQGTEDFRQKISNALHYEDWGDKLADIKSGLGSSGSGASSKDYKLCEIPIYCYVVIRFKVYLTLSFKIEASVHYEQHTTNIFTTGVRAAIGEGFHSFHDKKEECNTKEFTLIGKVELKAGVKLEVTVGDPLGLVELGVYGTFGAYVDLVGILHISTEGENYAAAYFEMGFYYEVGVTYRVCYIISGSVKLFDGKIPLLKMGYDKVIYGYVNDVEQTLVQASEVKTEFTLQELGLMSVKSFTLPAIKMGTETLDPTSPAYMVKLSLQEGKYYEIDGTTVKVKSNAPFGESFEDLLTISITSRDKSWKAFRDHNEILYLPTIQVKLIGAVKCQEHAFICLQEVEAQCLETGLEECAMCTRCGKLFDVDRTKELTERVLIPALGHDATALAAVEPTCYLTGLKEGSICQRCNEILIPQEEVPALGHTAAEKWYVEKEATCTGQGISYQICMRCSLPMNRKTTLPHGHVVGDQELSCEDPIVCTLCDKVLARELGHDYHVTGGSKAATCETAGYEIRTCSRCSDVKRIILPATGHSKREEAKDAWVSKDPTCVNAGEWSWHCTHENCDVEGGKVCTEAINPVGHLYDEEYTIDLEPTCTKAGEKSYRCLVCNVRKADSVVTLDPLGHSSTPATCTEAEVCERCHVELAPALGHNYQLVEPGNESALYRCARCLDEVLHAHDFAVTTVQPTCSSQGYTEHACKDEFCNHYTYRSDFTQRSHIWQEAAHRDATCSQNGYVDYVCQYEDCAEVKHEVLTTQHVYDEEYTIDVAATCSAKGSKSRHCRWYDDCGSKTDVTEISKLDHTLDRAHATCEEDSTCTTCGQILEKATGHSYQEVDGTREYTGYTALYRCGNCGDEKREAFEHHFDGGEVIAPTCIAEGYTLYRCTDPGCGFTKKENYTGKGDHVYPSSGVRSEPTCTEEGYITFTCSECGHKEDRSYVGNVPLGHYWSVDAAVAPTCTRPGKTEGRHCLRCKHVDIAQEEISALGHDYKATVIAPTCTEQGYTHYACRRNCEEAGAEYDGNYVAAHGLEKVSAKAATCSAAGNVEYYRCKDSACGKLYADANGATLITNVVTPALGHNFDHNAAPVDERAATCSLEGYKTYKCIRCDVTETIWIDKLPHTVTTDAAKSPTCTETGKTEGSHCSVCKEILVAQEVVPALGHSYRDVVTAPTCVEMGYTTHTCTRCSQSYVDTYTDAHGLTYVGMTGAGCTKPGELAHYKCSKCGKLYWDENGAYPATQADVEIKPTGHNHLYTSEYLVDHDKNGNALKKYQEAYRCTSCLEDDGIEVRNKKFVVSFSGYPSDCSVEYTLVEYAQMYGAGSEGALPKSKRTGYSIVWHLGSTTGATITDNTKMSDVFTENSVANHTLYPTWLANVYTVTFDSNGGSCSVPSTDVTYDKEYGKGTAGSLPTPTRTGYSFVGWYTAASGGSKVVDSTVLKTAAEHTIYAHWEKFKVTLNVNNVSDESGAQSLKFTPTISSSLVTVTYGSTAQFAVPTNSMQGYYLFVGYYTAKTGGTQLTDAQGNLKASVNQYTNASAKWIRTSNTTIYAHWRKTYADYSYVMTKADMSAIGTNATTKAGKYYLIADLNLGEWNSPFGFCGEFNGGGHTITYSLDIAKKGIGMHSNNSEYKKYEGGLFNDLYNGAKVQDLIVDCSIALNDNTWRGFSEDSNGQVGGLTGLMWSYTSTLCPVIERVTVRGSIVINNETICEDYNNQTSGQPHGTGIGGIVGYAYSGTIRYCKSSVKIFLSEGSVGGIVGRVWMNDGSVTIENCTYVGSSEKYYITFNKWTSTQSYTFELDESLASRYGCVGGIIGQYDYNSGYNKENAKNYNFTMKDVYVNAAIGRPASGGGGLSRCGAIMGCASNWNNLTNTIFSSCYYNTNACTYGYDGNTGDFTKYGWIKTTSNMDKSGR